MNKKIVYFDKDVVVINDVKKQMLENYSLADYMMLLFVRGGELQMRLEEKTYQVPAKHLLICLPQQQLLECRCSDDFVGGALYIRHEIINHTLPNKVKVVNDFFHLYSQPIIPITDLASATLKKYVDILETTACQPEKGYYKEIANALFTAILYECLSMIERDPKSDDSRYVKQGERLFKDFMKILATDKIKSRSVSAYAQRLFITPKYLSSVSKQLTGKTASVWINEAIVKEAKRQLKYTDKSVKEIAMQMDFPNVSFFGKYFKTHVGISPMEYRRGK